MIEEAPVREDSPLWCAIVDALKECIEHHGSIGKRYVGSATKRIMRNILMDKQLMKLVPDDVKMMLRQMGVRKLGMTKTKTQRVIDRRNETVRRLRLELKLLREKHDQTQDTSRLRRNGSGLSGSGSLPQTLP